MHWKHPPRALPVLQEAGPISSVPLRATSVAVVLMLLQLLLRRLPCVYHVLLVPMVAQRGLQCALFVLQEAGAISWGPLRATSVAVVLMLL